MYKSEEEKYDLIEKFLKGELSDGDFLAFEKALKQDSDLVKAVANHKILLESFEIYYSRRHLKNQLDAIHEEMQNESTLNVSKNKNRTIWRRLMPVAASIAACLLIFIITDSLFTWNNVKTLEEKQTTSIEQLKGKIENVEKEQEKISEKLEEQEENEDKDSPASYRATAIAIASNGYLITNHHVVKDAHKIYVETYQEDGQKIRLRAEEIYALDDLALLRIVDSSFIGFEELPYSLKTQEADLGESVFTLAYPRREMVYGEGSISAKSGYRGDTTAYQISVPVNPGNSGSPLFDKEGNLIGIINQKDKNIEAAAFAIKSNMIVAALDSLKQRNSEVSYKLAQKNNIQFLERPEQIKKLEKFVFKVKVYETRK